MFEQISTAMQPRDKILKLYAKSPEDAQVFGGAAAPGEAPFVSLITAAASAAVPPDDSPFASAVGTPQTTQNAVAQDRMTETGFLWPASVIDFLHISIRCFDVFCSFPLFLRFPHLSFCEEE
jgi:hypothetical protein